MLRGLRRTWPVLAPAVTALALLAMLVRVAAPPGYMLSASADHLITVVLCSGQGEATSLLDLQTGKLVDRQNAPKDDAPADAGKDAPCVFAAIASLAAPVAAPVLAAPPKIAEAAPTPSYAAVPGRGLAAPPPWATGPPHTI